MTEAIKTKGVILPALITALIFLAAGITKFAAADFQVQLFEMLGLPSWSMYAVGALEIFGAVLLFSCDTMARAAMLLGALMVGAIALYATHGGWDMALVPASLLGLLGVVAWDRRAEIGEMLRRLPQVAL